MCDNTIEATVNLLHARSFTPEVFEKLSEVARHRKVFNLVAAMLDFEHREGKTSEDAVYQAMNTAQSIAAIDPLMACLLMSQLYDFASDLFMHDVCDSIDIWIYKNHTPDLKQQLQLNMPSNMDEAMRNHYEEWIRG